MKTIAVMLKDLRLIGRDRFGFIALLLVPIVVIMVVATATQSGDGSKSILFPVVNEAIERSGIERRKIGFTCSASCDYLAGAPFSFVSNLEATGAWPPIEESHVEQDGAWAMYE